MYPSDALAALRWRRRTGRPVVLTYMGIPARAWLGAARGRRALPPRRAADGTGQGLDGPGVEWVDQDHRAAVMAGIYGEAWVSALPAVDEAFGLALVESLACGTPVVGYAQGGIPEILDRPGI